MNVRLKTAVVCQRGSEFLVGVDPFGNIKWSTYIYDAWRTRKIEEAKLVAKITNSKMVLFNSATGERRPL